MEVLDLRNFKDIFRQLYEEMVENRSYLTELGEFSGNGNFATTIETTFYSIKNAFNNPDTEDIGSILKNAAILIIENTHSTFCILFAFGLIEGSNNFKGKSFIGLKDFTQFVSSLVDEISSKGKARLREKTVLDSLFPAVCALKKAVKDEKTFKDGLKMAYNASKIGMAETVLMVPQHGIQATNQIKSIGQVDPGAFIGYILIKVFHNFVCEPAESEAISNLRRELEKPRYELN